MFKFPAIQRIVIVFAIMVASSVYAVAQDKNLTAEQILARHLRSFGSTEAIAQSVNRMAVGQADFKMYSTQKSASGKAVLASDGKNLALFSTFDLIDYRMERIGLFSNKVSIPIVEQGHRSPLGSFLSTYDKLLENRLFGGSIFSTWVFYSTDQSGLTMDFDGKKKVGSTEAWVVKVTPKGGLGSGSYIKLFFDTKDFHHIRTLYRQSETERGFFSSGSRDDSKGKAPGGWDQDMANNGTTLTEDFSDFSPDAAGISLPHKYSVLLSIDGVQGSSEFKWDFQIAEYKLIKQFPGDFFTFKATTP
jgi:hypothetical protein